MPEGNNNKGVKYAIKYKKKNAKYMYSQPYNNDYYDNNNE